MQIKSILSAAAVAIMSAAPVMAEEPRTAEEDITFMTLAGVVAGPIAPGVAASIKGAGFRLQIDVAGFAIQAVASGSQAQPLGVIGGDICIAGGGIPTSVC